ncbi:MAG: type IV pilus biogenesis protein PilM [Vicinamibacterales bacterium]
MSIVPGLLSLRAAPAPSAAVEVAANHVCAATLDVGGSRPTVTAHAAEGLPDDVVVPSLTATNLVDRHTVVAMLRRVLDAVGRPRRVALILPDTVAKVSLVKFEKPPANVADLDQLIRWQVRKAAPFPIEHAQVSYVPGARHADGLEYLVSLARRDVVCEYEDACQEAGAHAGLVDLSTFNVANAVLAGAGTPQGDWLLVNVAPDSASIMILRGADPIFFRNRAAEADGTLADLVHQTAMYYQDRLQGTGFSRVLFCGATAGGRQAAEVDRLRQGLEQRLSLPVETIDPRDLVTLGERTDVGRAVLDALTPVVGILLRGRRAAA